MRSTGDPTAPDVDALVAKLLALPCPPPPVDDGSMRLRLLLTAERLVATNGVHGASLRQVASEAGNSNSSAVSYHFGSKEGLLVAVYAHRLPRIHRRRRELLTDAIAEGRSLDLRTVVHAFLRPVHEEAEEEDSHYAGFANQLNALGLQSPFYQLPVSTQKHSIDFFRLVRLQLPDHLREPIRTNRVGNAALASIHLVAERQRRRRIDPDAATLPFDVFAGDLLDSIVAGLGVTMSSEVERALGSDVGRPEVQLFAIERSSNVSTTIAQN